MEGVDWNEIWFMVGGGNGLREGLKNGGGKIVEGI